MRYLCLIFFFLCLLSVIILSLYCLSTVCLRHNPWVSVSASYRVTSLHPTLHLKHTSHILEWWHCLCLLLWLWILKLWRKHNVTLSLFSFFLFVILLFPSLLLSSTYLSPSPSSLGVSLAHHPPSFRSITLPNLRFPLSLTPFTPFSPRSMWDLHSPRQCWER